MALAALGMCPQAANAFEVHLKQVLACRAPAGASVMDWCINGSTSSSANERKSFEFNEEVHIGCQFGYSPADEADKFEHMEIGPTVDGIYGPWLDVWPKDLAGYKTQKNIQFFKQTMWRAGTRKIGCKLFAQPDSDPSGNTMEITVNVAMPRPLTAAEIPAPEWYAPKPREKLVLNDGSSVLFVGITPDVAVRHERDFSFYATNIRVGTNNAYKYYYNLEIHRRRSVQRGDSEQDSPRLVGTLRKETDVPPYWNFSLTKAWFDEHGAGPGEYSAVFYFSEVANGVTTKGASATIAFELVEPLRASEVKPQTNRVADVGPAAKTPAGSQGPLRASSGQPTVSPAAGPATSVPVPALATLLNVEGEAFITGKKFALAGGKVTEQSMSGFGMDWSDHRQLLWSGASVGSVLDLTIDVPVSATYAVELYATRGPDYGQAKIQVQGQDAVVALDGCAPKVMSPSPMQLGKFSLAQGPNTLSLMMVGKNPQCTGFLVGIDRVRLYPVGPP